ncbi:hypothetical protein RCL_jg26266.t1 [Rhizophagus clarus]|uniref:Uncharacterized protein n=1 Tax=Rhizophagus clarus TaxID=94130 RepID=A0A8H3QES8_9GLOM|nr:hypothetical protein RCL_jg26266.t1 [Rhizophagus clarus]
MLSWLQQIVPEDRPNLNKQKYGPRKAKDLGTNLNIDEYEDLITYDDCKTIEALPRHHASTLTKLSLLPTTLKNLDYPSQIRTRPLRLGDYSVTTTSIAHLRVPRVLRVYMLELLRTKVRIFMEQNFII